LSDIEGTRVEITSSPLFYQRAFRKAVRPTIAKGSPQILRSPSFNRLMTPLGIPVKPIGIPI